MNLYNLQECLLKEKLEVDIFSIPRGSRHHVHREATSYNSLSDYNIEGWSLGSLSHRFHATHVSMPTLLNPGAQVQSTRTLRVRVGALSDPPQTSQILT